MARRDTRADVDKGPRKSASPKRDAAKRETQVLAAEHYSYV